MTPDQITRMFRTTTTPPHQAHLDTSNSSRITTTVSTRLKTLIPHRSPLIHTPDSSDGTRDFDIQCLAADFYLTVYNDLTTTSTSPSTPGTHASTPRNNGLAEYQSSFDAQTKHKDKYYTPKLPELEPYQKSRLSALPPTFIPFLRIFPYTAWSIYYSPSMQMPTPYLMSQQFIQLLSGCGRSYIRPVR